MQRNTNYSLVSLLEKIERQRHSERQEVATQTDADNSNHNAQVLATETPSFFAGKKMTVNVRKTGLHLTIK